MHHNKITTFADLNLSSPPRDILADSEQEQLYFELRDLVERYGQGNVEASLNSVTNGL
jgi:hypothetical protein